MSAKTIFSGIFAVSAIATLAPALADDGIPLASVARELGYRYAYLPLENAVSLTREGAVVVVRPGDAFFTINNRREPVYGFVPVYRDNDVVVSRAFEDEIRYRRRSAQGPAPRSGPIMVDAPAMGADGTVQSVQAYYLPSTSEVEVTGKANPGTHVTIKLRADLAQDLPTMTVDGTEVTADGNGTYKAYLNASPDHFSYSRFFVEAAGGGDTSPTVAAVTSVAGQQRNRTGADDAMKGN